MNRYHVALSWKTEAGSLATAALVIVAADGTQAIGMATRRIISDRRRRYARGMNATARRID